MDAVTRSEKKELRQLVQAALLGCASSEQTDEAFASELGLGARPADKARKCSRCDGTGFIASYSHIAHGRCAACMGAGKSYSVSKAAKEWEARVVTARAQEQMGRLCTAAAELKAIAAQHPAIAKQAESAIARLRERYRRCKG